VEVALAGSCCWTKFRRATTGCKCWWTVRYDFSFGFICLIYRLVTLIEMFTGRLSVIMWCILSLLGCHFTHHFYAFLFCNSCIFLWGVFFVGGEDGRHNNWSSSDPTRRRNPVPFANDGVLSRQKGAITYDSTLSKDVTVRLFICDMVITCVVMSSYFLQKV